jgi:hypothetical protein
MRAWQRPQRTAPITSRRVTKRTGTSDLQGIVGPLQAWAALRASSIERRFEALHTAGLTTLMGREEELELLLRAGREQTMAKAKWCSLKTPVNWMRFSASKKRVG